MNVWEKHNMYKQCQLIIKFSLSNYSHYPPLPSSLLSYTSLFSLYLDWKLGPRCKGDSTLQLWYRAWSMWLSLGLLSQKDSFFEWCCGSISVNSSIINLVLGVHCDPYMHRIDNCSLREGSVRGTLGEAPSHCHKLHSAISSPILRRFPRSQGELKALKKTFRSIPVTSRSDQYWPRY